MNTAGKLSAYGVALALVAGGAWATGSAVGPLENTAAATEGAGHGDTPSGTVAETAQPDLPAGWRRPGAVTPSRPTSTTLNSGPNTFSFRVTGPDGKPVTRFEIEHEKRMHLIVVRRDTAGFQHVHPEMGADGTWTVPLTLTHRAATGPSPTSHPPAARRRRSAWTSRCRATSGPPSTASLGSRTSTATRSGSTVT